MDHCDFVPLRNMLIRTHLQDLKEVTNNVHYENYRCRKLAGVAGGTVEKIPNKVILNTCPPFTSVNLKIESQLTTPMKFNIFFLLESSCPN